MERGTDPIVEPLLFTERKYPCGCTASGPGDVPAYCPTHDPLLSDRQTLQTIVDAYDMRSELFTSDAECAANLSDRARRALRTTEGEVTVVTDSVGNCVAVTRTNSEHRILKVIWERPVVKDPPILFYGTEHYYLSNFSAFNLYWWRADLTFATSEAAYQWSKFDDEKVRKAIHSAPSAHEAYKIAEVCKDQVRLGWSHDKVSIMREILFQKAHQHEYVARKLRESGDRELIEDSWRDSYWGWGQDRNGMNMLGKLWMEVRAERKRNPNA